MHTKMFVGTRQLKYFILQFTVRNKRNGTNDTIRGTRYTFIHFKLKKKKKRIFIIVRGFNNLLYF